jgi:hypothetical protein
MTQVCCVCFREPAEPGARRCADCSDTRLKTIHNGHPAPAATRRGPYARRD